MAVTWRQWLANAKEVRGLVKRAPNGSGRLQRTVEGHSHSGLQQCMVEKLKQIWYKASRWFYNLLEAFRVVETTTQVTKGGWEMVATNGLRQYEAGMQLNFTPSLLGG